MLESIMGLGVLLAAGAAVYFAQRDSASRRAAARLERERHELRQRFATVLDLEEEAARVRAAFESEHRALDEAVADARRRSEEEMSAARRTADHARQELHRDEAATRARQDEISRAYAKARETFDRLQREVALLEENLEDISFGVYRPHYDFATSAEYRARLDAVWEEQKAVIKADRAVRFGVEWAIGGSRREGERMQRQYAKLLLRAFNGECDASIAKVAWNNATRMEERIRKGFDTINQLGGVMQISIAPEYRELRLQELRLHHELEEKKQAEKEEQRRLREQMRDEERAQRELEKAREDAEAEEHRHERALEKARKEMERAKDEEARRALTERIQQLETELEEAHREKERAISRAQMTRSGHVYIISNIGSFGEEVVKIGMTRRLDPRDRIKELGDASVPFDFDVHGLVFAEDAPALEAELHRQFADRRLNLVNQRREFFRVRLPEIDAFLRSKAMALELTLLAEAREYRETVAIRQRLVESAAEGPRPEQVSSSFPASLFGDAHS